MFLSRWTVCCVCRKVASPSSPFKIFVCFQLKPNTLQFCKHYKNFVETKICFCSFFLVNLNGYEKNNTRRYCYLSLWLKCRVLFWLKIKGVFKQIGYMKFPIKLQSSIISFSLSCSMTPPFVNYFKVFAIKEVR